MIFSFHTIFYTGKKHASGNYFSCIHLSLKLSVVAEYNDEYNQEHNGFSDFSIYWS